MLIKKECSVPVTEHILLSWDNADIASTAFDDSQTLMQSSDPCSILQEIDTDRAPLTLSLHYPNYIYIYMIPFDPYIRTFNLIQPFNPRTSPVGF